MNYRHSRHCTGCGAALETPLDEWGDVSTPLCWSCYKTLMDETAEAQASYVKDCPACHQHSFYDKGEVGYGGLWHCASCGLWMDVSVEPISAWRYEHKDGGRPLTVDIE